MSNPFDDPAFGEPPRERRPGAEPRVLPKRFYKAAGYAAAERGFRIELDGRPVKTPMKAPLVVADEAVASAIAAEWDAQRDFIRPGSMPLTRLANAAIDAVALDPGPVKAEIVRYAGSDLLCYRAPGPQSLVDLQERYWTPPIDWMHERFGVRFLLAEGIIAVEQFPETLAAVDRAIGSPDPLTLAALSTVNALTGSAILTLALAYRHMSAEEVWRAAHVDEDFEISLWGADEEASDRRAARWLEMQASALVIGVAPSFGADDPASTGVGSRDESDR